MAINKTTAGTYAVDFRDQFGKRIQKTFAKHRDAVDYEKESSAQVARREYVRPTNETLKEIAEKWRQRKVDAKKPDGTPSYKRSSIEQWKNHVNRFIVAELGQLKVHGVDVEAIERAAAKWQERVSPKTANKILTTLTAVLDLAKRYKLIKENPAREAERLKLATADEDSDEVTPDKVYNKGELKKLIEATEPGSRDRLFVMVPALLGLRIGEVLALTWPAIDLKAGKLRVILNLADSAKGEEPLFQAPKTKSSRRTLSVPQELIHELKVWKLRCPHSERDLVFATEEGKPFHRKSASKILNRAIEKAELEKRLTPHGLRHSFASLLLADGRPAPEVAAYLGHKDCSVTLKVYAHFVREETQAVHNLAASILTAGQS
jgi:integrase